MLDAIVTVFVVGFCLGISSFCPPLGILLLIVTGHFDL